MKPSRSLATLIEGITSPSLFCFAGGDKLEGLCPSSSQILVNQVYFSSQCFSFLTHRIGPCILLRGIRVYLVR